MSDKKLSRRDLLKVSATAATAALVASQFSNESVHQVHAQTTVTAGPPVEIVFVTQETNDSNSKIIAPLLQSYQATHPNFNVRWLGVTTSGWAPYFNKIALIIAGGDQLDMVKIPIEGGRLAVARGLVQPLDQYLQATDLSAYFNDVSPKLADVFKFKGVTYGLPFDYNNMMIMYNPKLLQAAGLDAPKEDWTYTDFLKYARALTVKSGDTTTTYGYASAPQYGPFGLCPWLFNNGLDGMLGGPLLDQPLQTDPAYVQVVQMLTDMVNEGVMPSVDSPTYANTVTDFEGGKVAMMGAGHWPVGTFVPDGFTDYATQYFPTGTRRVTQTGCGTYMILAAFQHHDADWGFLAWLLRPESLAYIGSQSANTPAIRSAATSAEYVAHPAGSGQLYYQSIDRPDIAVMSVTAPPDYGDMEASNGRNLADIFSGKVSVAEGLANMQTEMQTMIAARPPEWSNLF